MAAGTGMNNLTTLIKRLEAATSRLEDIASSAATLEQSRNNRSAHADVSAAKTVVNGAPNSLPLQIQTSRTATPPLPASVQDFDGITKDDLKPFADLSEKLGGFVAEQVAAFCMAFRAQREVLVIADRAKEPSHTSPVFQEILMDLQHGMERVNNIREKNRKSPQENHLAMIADGVAVLAWVTIKGEPYKYVQEVLGGAQVYGNKILMANKDKPTPDVDWVRSFVRLCGALVQYIKEHHRTGLRWNAQGTTPEEALQEIKASSLSPKSGAPNVERGATAAPAPPPPPPPPLPQLDIPPPPGSAGVRSSPAPAGDMGAVFSELNRGEAVTSGLRRVEKSEMTHKNPSLRAQAPVPARSDSGSSRGKSPAPPLKKQKPESMRTKKPPRKELDANKWSIENFEREATPVEIDAERNHSVLITKCRDTVIKVNGKANAISIDNCTGLGLIMESLVSSVDVVNSGKFQLQVNGILPSIQLDRVDSANIFLSPESLKTEIYTSKCTAINITLLPRNEQDDSIECPVPEQIRSTIVDGKVISEIVRQEG